MCVLIRRYFVICAKDNKARVNSGYGNDFFTIYGVLKMLFCQFQKTNFSNFKMTFAKRILKEPSLFMRNFQSSLCIKMKFSIKVSPVNASKSAGNWGFGYIYWKSR